MNVKTINKLMLSATTLLFIINLGIFVSWLWNKNHVLDTKVKQVKSEISAPKDKRNFGHTMFNALNLDENRKKIFMGFNGEYHEKFREISLKMDNTHIAILKELQKSFPDSSYLKNRAIEYGILAGELKSLTIKQFTNIKSLLNKDQETIMIGIYRDIIDSTEAKINKHKHIEFEER